MEYEYLKKEERDIYKKNILHIVKSAHEKKIHSLVVAGASGAPVGTLFINVWRVLYPNENRPGLYSIEFVDRTLGIKHSFKLDKLKKSEIEKIRKKLSLNYPNLDRDIKEKKSVLLIDEYASTGRTLRARKELLRELGAKEVYTAALTVNYRDYKTDIDKLDIKVIQSDLPSWYLSSRSKKIVGNKSILEKRKKLARDFKKLAQEISEEIK